MTTTTIDLDQLTLAEGAHRQRASGVCLMEAVAWYAGEDHSDMPACVSPVLRGYGIRLNDSLPAERRQELKQYIPALIGTANDGLDPQRLEIARRTLMNQWLPQWLRLAKLDDLAVQCEVGAELNGQELNAALYAIRDLTWKARQEARKRLKVKVETELRKRWAGKPAADADADADAAAAAVAAAVAAAAVAGRPGTQRVVIGVLETAGISSGNQDKGRVNHTAYEFVHLVEVTDAHEADRLRHQLMQVRADRGLAAKQPALFDATEAEQRESLLDMIRDWASEQDIPMPDVDARWVDYFGGTENAASETVQASRSVAQLKEFAYAVGAIAENDAEQLPLAAPESSDDEGDEDSLEEDLTPTSTVPGVPFQADPTEL